MLIHCHALTPLEIMKNLDKLVTGLLLGTALVMTDNPTNPALIHILNNTFGLTLYMLTLK